MMNFSPTTTDLIFDVQDFSQRRVIHISPVSILIELTYTSGNREIFNDLIFKAKYLKGLRNISQKEITANDVDVKSANDKIVAEISIGIKNLTKLIQDIISGLPAEVKADFENNFFLLDKDCLSKYYELIEDLSAFKEYFNANS